MIKEKLIEKALMPETKIGTNRSRCLRMRYNRNECRKCLELCSSGAITIDEDIVIDTDACTRCLLCLSACPADSFEISGNDFYSLIGALRKIGASVSSPVLGCSVGNKACHAKTSCFGFLSEEHILALTVFMQDPVQIDMTGCQDCRNSFIAAAVEKRISDLEEKTALKIADRVIIVKNSADLDFREVSYDRRGFFKALKNRTLTQAAGLFDKDLPDEATRSYSFKKLPLKRDLLNRALKALPDDGPKALLKNYYYEVRVTDACDNCFACIGMCPTGAMKIDRKGPDPKLMFNSSLCSGCGLCEGFCMNNAICIGKGFSGRYPFEFLTVQPQAAPSTLTINLHAGAI